VLGALGALQAVQMLRELWAQLSGVSGGTLSLTLQVIANTLRMQGPLARALLAQCGSASAISPWETSLLLLLLPMPRHAAATTQALVRALRRRALAASTLAACATDPALPATVWPRLPPLIAALLADPSPAAATQGALLAVGLAGNVMATSTSGAGRGGEVGCSDEGGRLGLVSAWPCSLLPPGLALGPMVPPSLSPGLGSELDHQRLGSRVISEVLSALYGSPTAAAAAADALAALARTVPAAAAPLWAASAPLLLEALIHAPRLQPAWQAPLCSCLAAAACEQPSLRAPLLLFIQKHALALSHTLPHNTAPQSGAAACADAAPLRVALALVEALLRGPGALASSEAATVMSWLLQAAPITAPDGADIADVAAYWRLLARCIGWLPIGDVMRLRFVMLPRALWEQGVALPPPANARPSLWTQASVEGAVGGGAGGVGSSAGGAGALGGSTLLLIASTVEEAGALGGVWLTPRAEWAAPPVHSPPPHSRSCRLHGVWLAQLLCAFRCDERVHKGVTTSATGTVAAALPAAPLTTEALTWALAIPAPLGPLVIHLLGTLRCGTEGGACDSTDEWNGSDRRFEHEGCCQSVGVLANNTADAAVTAHGVAAAAAVDTNSDVPSAADILALVRRLIGFVSLVDLTLRWGTHCMTRGALSWTATATGSNVADASTSKATVDASLDGALLQRLSDRCQLVALIDESVRALTRVGARLAASQVQAVVAACLQRPLPPRLCVRALGRLTRLPTGRAAAAVSALVDALPMPQLRLLLLQELAKSVRAVQERKAAAHATVWPVRSPDGDEHSRGDLVVDVSVCGGDGHADYGSVGGRCSGSSVGGGGGFYGSAAGASSISGPDSDTYNHGLDDLVGGGSDDGDSDGEDGCQTTNGTSGLQPVSWPSEALTVLVQTAALLSAEAKEGRLRVARSSDRSQAGPAWRTELEALGLCYVCLAACCRFAPPVPPAPEGVLHHLRQQLPQLAEPHLACAFLDAVCALEAFVYASEGCKPAGGEGESGVGPGSDSDAAGSATRPAWRVSTNTSRRLAMRALCDIYPVHMPALARYLPRLPAPPFGLRGARANGSGCNAAMTLAYRRYCGHGSGAWRQHSALCSLVSVALCMLPANQALRAARALCAASDELSTALATAHSTTAAALSGSSSDHGSSAVYSASEGGTLPPLPDAHHTITLLTPAARPAMLLALLGHLTLTLATSVPISSGGALRRLLAYAPRAAALAARILASLLTLLRSLPTRECVGLAALVASASVALCIASRTMLAAAVERRCRPGCQVPLGALAVLHAVSTHMLKAQRDLVNELKCGQMGAAVASPIPGGTPQGPLPKRLKVMSQILSGVSEHDVESLGTDEDEPMAAAGGDARGGGSVALEERGEDEDDNREGNEEEVVDDEVIRSTRLGKRQQSARGGKAAPLVCGSRRTTPSRGRVGGNAGGEGGGDQRARKDARPTTLGAGTSRTTERGERGLAIPRLQLKLEQLELMLVEMRATHHVPEASEGAVRRVLAWATVDNLNVEDELGKLGCGASLPDKKALVPMHVSRGVAAVDVDVDSVVGDVASGHVVSDHGDDGQKEMGNDIGGWNAVQDADTIVEDTARSDEGEGSSIEEEDEDGDGRGPWADSYSSDSGSEAGAGWDGESAPTSVMGILGHGRGWHARFACSDGDPGSVRFGIRNTIVVEFRQTQGTTNDLGCERLQNV